jgi:RimJ/RimL family protein N-acetyltransferase/predicted CoA-binding protein
MSEIASTRQSRLPEPVDVVLRDGSSVRLRPVRREDRERVRAFLASLSEWSLTYRFFGVPNLEWAADWAVQVGEGDRCAIVAETGAEGRIVAHAAYVREDDRSAEVAFVVSDELQGHGIATLMLAYLAQVAARHGIECFTAAVLPTNQRMIETFRYSGFPLTLRRGEGQLRVRMPTTISEQTLQAFERRRARAAAAAVARFLQPRSLALVGASRRPGSIGSALLRNILAGGYRGRLHLVNRTGGEIAQLPVLRSALELPEPAELAVIAVPAAQVRTVADDCGRAGVRALLVISAGFAELGAAGREHQQALLETCRRYGMRLIGPNCLGVINTSPEVSLNATFAAHAPPRGTIGFLSQSGGLGIALFEAASRLGLGISSFVSVGNKADISGNDLLEYWEEDERTELILLYPGIVRQPAADHRRLGRDR